MKTKIYILLILSLTFSVANAQSNDTKETVSTEVTSENNDKVDAVKVISTDKVETSSEPTIIEGSIARGYSDIRVYRNRIGNNAKNIDFLFPKIYKQRTA